MAGQSQGQEYGGLIVRTPPSLILWGYRNLLWFFAFLAGATLLQYLGDAFSADFSMNPDESAHYVTGLMVHDYLLTFPWQNPLHYAHAYYEKFPKVAIGHWPPFFYILETIWMFVFSQARASVVMLNTCIEASIALTLFVTLRRQVGTPIAIFAGGLFECLPLVQTFAHLIMPEMLMGALMLWAALAYARFMRTERPRDGLIFAAFACLAILTKPNGLALALLPPLAILASRRFRFARQLVFWLPVPVVLLMCGPWYGLTLPLMQDGWVGPTGTSSVVEAFGFHSYYFSINTLALFRTLGWALTGLAVIGVLSTIIFPWPMRRVRVEPSVMIALLLSVWLFHTLIIPLGEPRHMIPATPPLVAFAAMGIASLRDWFNAKGRFGRLLSWTPIGLAACAFAAFTFSIPLKKTSKADEVVESILAQPDWAKSTILVSSRGNGEGAIIAEFAMREKRSENKLIRASKILAKSDWSGQYYRPLYKNPDEISSYLEKTAINLVVIDLRPRPDKPHDQHTAMLLQAMASDSKRWHRMGDSTTPSLSENYGIFRRIAPIHQTR